MGHFWDRLGLPKRFQDLPWPCTHVMALGCGLPSAPFALGTHSAAALRARVVHSWPWPLHLHFRRWGRFSPGRHRDAGAVCGIAPIPGITPTTGITHVIVARGSLGGATIDLYSISVAPRRAKQVQRENPANRTARFPCSNRCQIRFSRNAPKIHMFMFTFLGVDATSPNRQISSIF